MTTKALVAFLLAAAFALDTTASAQQSTETSRGSAPKARQQDGAADRSPPPSQDLHPRSSGSQHGDEAPELYMQRPGVYVIPGPYSPDYYSPTYRSYPAPAYVQPGWQSRGVVPPPRHRGSRGNWGYWVPGPRACGSGRAYPPGYDWAPWGGGWAAGYEQGRYDADHDYIEYIAAQRAGRLLNQWAVQFDEAIILFRAGRYEQAAINMLGAAEKNHADGASRLHAGHALFALGRYEEAVPLIERAFELAPSLAYNSYDIRDEYGDKALFEGHVEALRAYVAHHPESAGAVTLLGYVTYYSEGPSTAYRYLKRAASLNPRSYFIPKLLTPASMVRPSLEGEPVRRQQTPPMERDQPRQDATKSKSAPLAPDRSGQVVARAADAP